MSELFSSPHLLDTMPFAVPGGPAACGEDSLGRRWGDGNVTLGAMTHAAITPTQKTNFSWTSHVAVILHQSLQGVTSIIAFPSIILCCDHLKDDLGAGLP